MESRFKLLFPAENWRPKSLDDSTIKVGEFNPRPEFQRTFLLPFKKVSCVVAHHTLNTLIDDFAILVTLYITLCIVYFLFKVHRKSLEIDFTHVFLTLFVLLVSHNLQMLLFVELRLFSYRQSGHQ